MSSGDANHQEVISRYEAIENPHFRDRKEAHLENLRDEETDTGEVASRYTNKLKTSKQRDEILKTLISAFLPTSRLTSETGWEFKSFLPLPDMDGDSPEVVFGNPQTGGVILANTLPERERPETTILRLESAVTLVSENRHTFSEEIGMDINEADIRCVLCVPEKADRRAEDALEDIRASRGLSRPIDIWRVDGPNNEKIDFYTTVDMQPDGGEDLDARLVEGLQVAKEIHTLPDFFPDSHHQLIAEHTVGAMVQRRLSDDAAKTHFTDGDFESYLWETLSYSDAEELAEEKCTNHLDRWTSMDLIEKLTPSQTDLEGDCEFYRFNVDSRGAGNIMKEVKSKYMELAIDYKLEIEAMRLVLEEFDEQQSSLEEWQ